MIQSFDRSSLDALQDKIIRCSVCTGIGHTKRSCPSNPDKDPETLGLKNASDFPEERRMTNISSHFTNDVIKWMNELVEKGKYPSRSELLRYALEDFKLRNTLDADKNEIFDEQLFNLQSTLDSIKDALVNQPKTILTNFFNFFNKRDTVMPLNPICKYCQIPFNSLDAIQLHFEECHPENSVERQQYLDYVRNSELSEYLFSNPIIGATKMLQNEEKSQKGEILQTAPSSNDQFDSFDDNICDICGDKLKNWKGVKLHKYYKHPETRTEDTVSEPKETNHKLPGQPNCDVCGKVCLNQRGLIRHQSIHKGQVTKPQPNVEYFSPTQAHVFKELRPFDFTKPLESGSIPTDLTFKFKDQKLSVQKNILDTELSERPISVWIPIEKSSGQFRNVKFTITDNAIEFSIHCDD